MPQRHELPGGGRPARRSNGDGLGLQVRGSHLGNWGMDGMCGSEWDEWVVNGIEWVRGPRMEFSGERMRSEVKTASESEVKTVKLDTLTKDLGIQQAVTETKLVREFRRPSQLR